ncbi:BTAD domain-containing putative transcriptional regulator [Catellatospora sp. KI3]|uniref:BTAD domain-containing putative transcriptional regulator n=1 Tax=Catellatospora sp. KI3 TaxID=3041620 RepID=UPI0024832465|nr:BTAD domain-containing putative transcriptional regulator [Catellatospora sp. KI3]MDI1462929.1 BTAD domain-containing putative transcriptional regulator [Catellatospora sp. KI3]
MSAVRINVLGAMTATVDGAETPLGGPRQRAVLASLVLARPRAVSAARIVEDVWDGEATPSPTTLHAYVAELRRVLEPGRAARAAARVLVTEGTGYALRLPPDAVDADLFARLTAEGAELLRRGDAESAHRTLTGALALWRGPAFADLDDHDFVAAAVRRLERLRDTATLDLLAAGLALGRHGELVPELTALTEQQPLAERAWHLLALALYRGGRQADALAAIRQAADLLGELGLDTGAALRDLEVAILRQDPALDLPTTESEVPTHNLPCVLTDLVGRRDELGTLTDQLERARLVTVTGTGGIGKTRLALHAAAQRADADGPWLVELAGLAQPELVVAEIATALGVAGAADATRLAAVLGTRRTLLVLDNCEHLVDAVRDTVATLLRRCPNLRVLTTSRESLGLTGEVVVELGPMRGEAAELFLSRARALLPGWAPTPADLARIGEICRELDGVPLAVELAAAQCRVLSLDQIAGSLGERGADADGQRPARHRDLAEAISWSFDLLPVPEQLLFGRLSVFAGGFDLDAAAAVAGLRPAALLPEVSALVRKSLLATEPGTAPRRYRLLTPVRAFAGRTVAEAEARALRRRHRGWVLDWAESAASTLRGPQSHLVLARIGTDQPETRAALSSALLDGDGEYALRLAAALSWFWYRRGHIAEGLGWLRSALDLAATAPPRVRGQAWLGVAGLTYLTGDPAEALRAANEAADLARAGRDRIGEAHAVVYQAHFHAMLGQLAEAVRLAERGRALAERTGLPWLRAEAMMILGMLRRLTGPPGRARAELDAAVRAGRSCGHVWAAGSAAWGAMKGALDAGDPDAALRVAAELLGPLDAAADVTSWLVLAHTTAAALAQAGRAEDAAVLLGAVGAHGARTGFAPAAMDPIDGPGEEAAVRAALPAAELDRCLAVGAGLSRAEVSALILRGSPAGNLVLSSS